MKDADALITKHGSQNAQPDIGLPRQRPLIYSTQLLDKPVVGPQGEHLGRVADLVVEVRGGSVAFLILDYRDGDKRFVLPYGSIRYDALNQQVCVDVAREVFEHTPGMALAPED